VKELLLSLTITAVWAFIVRNIWRSIDPTLILIRRTVAISGIISVCLAFITIFLIGRFVHVTESLYTALSQESGPAAVQIDSPDEIIVVVNTDGSITVNDMRTTPLQAESVLRSFLKKDARNMVTIISSPQATMRQTQQVLDVCERLKIDNVTFTVSQDE
jgi:biopolymer transport protein ExbD